MNSGSVDSLNVCERCGASTNARQICETVDCDIPVAAAIDLVYQCVAFFGLFQSLDHHPLDIRVRDRPRDARPGLARQALRAVSQEAPAPGAHCLGSDPKPLRHLHGRVAVRTLQHDS